ncbi:MAG: glycoside hydrolase family 31 protein [Chloroflexota bacterium]|nr:glycoside hydrolase family 31 protein [Chloroflexota bacterium]
MAKPRSPLTELAARWCPIFADPDRDYHWLAAIRSVRRTKSGARLGLAADDGTAAHLAVTFVQPEIVRLQLFLAQAPPPRTPMLVSSPPAPVDIELAQDREAVTLSSASLSLRLERQPWRLSVHNREGREVYRQQRLDRTLLEQAAYPMGYSRDGEGNVAFHESFSLALDEHLFGLGMQYGPLDKRGQRLISWSRDPYGLTASGVTYLNIPFFLSSRGYGIFVNHTGPVTNEMGWPSLETGAFQVDDPYLDYFLIYGPHPKDILGRYGQLTGRAPLPPLWSFGVWMSRCMYRDRVQVEEVVSRLRDLGIPCDVINLDPRWLKERKKRSRDGCDFVWDDEAFPDPAGFVGWLAERGVKLCLWENPYVWKGTRMYEEGLRRGYLVQATDGQLARPLENPDDAALVDFTNPRASRWWQDKHRPYLRMGVAAFKSDYGEALPEDARFADGKTGRDVHNVYPLLYNRAVFEVARQERGEAVVWGRSGYAGSQRYPLNWTGDSPSTFAGMAAALRAGLSLSLSGIPFWSHDIGGFWNPDNMKPPSPELYIRWAQFGLLSSHARFHGIGRREPWYYGEEAVAIVREFARLRYRLLPYLYALAHEACQTGVPVVRPLFLEFPEDPRAYQADLEYMLGPYLLVAPIFNEEGRCHLYLPPGHWYDFWSSERVDGPAYREMEVPLERLPLFVRGDSILPLAPAMDFVGQKAWEPIQLDVRVGSQARVSFPNPERMIEVEAQLVGSDLRLDIGKGGQAHAHGGQGFQIRFLAPGRLRDVRFSGRASDTAWEEVDGTTIVRLKAEGPCALEANVV